MTTSLHKKAIVAGVLVVVWAMADWLTLPVGVLKPILLGAGSLRVDCEALDAEVLLDGVLVGKTPLHIEALLTGDYVLQVRHRFHPPYVAKLRLERGQALVKHVKLLPAYGSLSLATNPKGATVELDGRRLNDLTPIRIDSIEAGTHELIVSIFAREVVNSSIEVLPNQEAEFVVELQRLDYAELTVRPTPSRAKVRFIDAAIAYQTKGRLPVGDYHIEVALPGYRTNSQIHSVRKGVNVIDVALERIQGRLALGVTPADATVSVRVGNNKLAKPYQKNMRLPAGRVEVILSKPGYRSVTKHLQLSDSGATLKVALQRFTVTNGQVLQDKLANGQVAPQVVVIPTGKASIGVTGSGTTTALKKQTVTFNQPFAIGVTEVTLGQFQLYAESANLATPKSKGMDSPTHPIAKITWREAVGYTQWLTRETTNRYRLPTEREWAYVAIKGAAGKETETDYCTQGNVADQQLHKVFPMWESVDCDDGWARSAPVGSYKANQLGVQDLLGNLSEWVSDCGYGGCGTHIARGSAWDSAAGDLRLTLRDSHSRPSDTRGFRVVREL